MEGPVVLLAVSLCIQVTLRDHRLLSDRYHVYILASRSRVLYVGVTNDLILRVQQHRDGMFDGFTKQYRVHRLVYYETFAWVQDAIAREKQIKRWRREKKLFLIERDNSTWEDLSESWLRPIAVRVHHPTL